MLQRFGVPAGVAGASPRAAVIVRAVPGRQDEWLTVKEIAQHLKVCTATVYKLVDRGVLPHLRVLNAVRVRRGDLEEGYLVACKTAD